jgi:outer membrane immunogenic protein
MSDILKDPIMFGFANRALSVVAFVAFASYSGNAVAQTFTGPHVEAVVGWNHIEGKTEGRGGDGVVYGASAGYDLRAGRVVAGPLAEITDASGSSCRNVGAGVPQGTSCVQNGLSLFGGGRIGMVVGEGTLLYVLGGYVNARERNSYKASPNASIPYLQKDMVFRRNVDGYRVGTGIEHAISNHAFLKAEYRYADVGDAPSSQQHQVVTGVGIRF